MVSRESKLKIVAFALLALSISLNFKTWVYDYTFLGYKYYSKFIDIKPSLITTLISFIFFGGYILRNVHEIFKDNIKIIFCVIDIIFFSGFIAMFADKNTNFLGFSSQTLLILIITLMWIGMKSLLRYIILAFITSSVYFLGQLNEAMGFFGALYIIFAFLSFSIQIYTNILPNYNKIPSEFFGQIKKEHKDEDTYNELEEN